MNLGRAMAVLGVAVAMGGCVADVGPERPIRMPTVGPSEPKVAVPVLSAAEVQARVVSAARREEWAEVRRLVASRPWAERREVAEAVVAELAAEDVARAGRATRAMPPGPALHAAAETVARVLVARDPGAAVEWALAADAPAVEFAVRLAVADACVARDARGALEALAAGPRSAGREELLGYAAAAWARRDATAALAWGRALGPGDGRTRVATSMGFALAQTEPERAEEVVALVPEGRDRWLIVGAMGQTWVARRPDEAWAWARGLPAGPAREAALAGIETGLGGARARREAGGIAGGGRGRSSGGGGGAGALLPPGAEREQALRREFEEVLRESPARAADWLATRVLPDRREEMVEEVARRWLAINPEAAEAWMERVILEPERREQLRREAGR